MDKFPISAFVVCFNEEENIAECLESMSFCDEVLVIDSFSTDNTVSIAESLGARVIQRKWPGYREQKSFGLSQVKNEWVLNLDADERVSPELANSIQRVMSRQMEGLDSDVNGYFINRVVFHFGRWWRLGGWYPEYRLRFLRKSKTVWGGVEPHEKPEVSGKTERIEGELYHYSYKDFDDQLRRMQHFSTAAAKELYQNGKRVSILTIFFNPIFRVIKFFIFKRGFREGIAGLIVAMTEGYYTFMKYAKIWELQFNQEQKDSLLLEEETKKKIVNEK